MGFFDSLLNAGSSMKNTIDRENERKSQRMKAAAHSQLVNAYDHTDDPDKKRKIAAKIREVRDM